MPEQVIISDTSCLILLTNIGELDLLYKVYGTIVTTAEIAIEYGETLPEWIIIENVTDPSRQQLLELQVDKGEASALALALETPHCTIILDDYKARKVAQQLQIKLTGTIGVIVKAKLNGVVPSIQPYLEKMKQTNFRLSSAVELQALIEAEEN